MTKMVSHKDLMVISGLAEEHLRYLHAYDLLDRKYPPASYALPELIYCRIAYYMIAYIGMPYLRSLIRSYDRYGDRLTSNKYGLLEISGNTAIRQSLPVKLGELALINELESILIEAELILNPVHLNKKIVVDRYHGEIEIDRYFFNLETIKTQVDPPPKAA